MINSDRLKALRIAKNLTQEQLGNLIGVHKSAICCYEKGTRQPTIEGLMDLIHVFNVPVDYLVGNDYTVISESPEPYNAVSMTKEEVYFIKELRQNKMVYEILLSDPKRGLEVINKKIG